MEITLRKGWQRCTAAVTIAAVCTMPGALARDAPPGKAAPCLACDGEAAVEEASRSFRKLRNLRGHFASGAWTPAVDAWGGELHRAMQTLAAWSVRHSLAAPALLELMGEPDEKRDCAAGACEPLLRSLTWPAGQDREAAGPASELWIYHWRGGRDRLVLVMREQRVAASGWRYLGE